jgi:tripartite-type tricarboxylate transporter receptor subunit TctC
MIRWLSGILLCAVAAHGSAQVPVDSYPSRVVRIVAGSAGVDSDVVARLVAHRLSQVWGQQFIVENNGAAGGTIGTAQCARAAPDGYTLCVGHVGTHASAPSLYKDLPYDPVRDFAPISQISSAPIVLVAHPSVAVATLKDVIGMAQADPGKLSYSSAGGGTASHLTGELLATNTNLKLLHVPYKGAGPALTSVLAGETNLSFLSLATAIGQIRAGKLKGITIFGRQRFSVAPDVPTAIEQGYPQLESTAWFGLFAPARTPEAIINKLNKEVVSMLGTHETQQALLSRGAEPVPTTPQQFSSFVNQEIQKWARVVTMSDARAN